MQNRSEANPRRNRQAGPTFDIQYTTHDVAIPGLPDALAGLRMVQISDLHRRGERYDPLIQATISRVNALDPDYVVITGDFIDHDKRDILPVVRMVAGLRAQRGIYGILGNHDHRGDPVLLESALEAAGVTVLTNRAVELPGGLWLAGVDDLLEGQGDLGATLEQVPDGAAAILLSHNPNALDEVPADRPLVILSGHTHGAQWNLPFPPPGVICRIHLRTRYVQGWYHRGAVRMLVNRGIGCAGWGFVARRFRCPSEVTQLRLQPGK